MFKLCVLDLQHEMKKYFVSFFFIILPLIAPKSLFAKDQCHVQEVINLSIFKKNDYKFYNYTCDSDQGSYLRIYLETRNSRVFIREYTDFDAKESPKLLAVSIYKSNKKSHQY